MTSTAELKLAKSPGARMDRAVPRSRWSPAHWPIGIRVIAAAVALIAVALLAVKLIAGSGVRTLRLPASQVTIATVQEGLFHDLIPLRANVVPRETVYIDAIDGGRVDRVLVEAGDTVEKGQPMIELSNTNLALSVIQQESQLNQAISQLQQNEIALEQNKLSNERAIAEIDYGLVRLRRAVTRRENLLARGGTSAEEHDIVADEMAYYQRLKPIQSESTERQAQLRARLLPDIHRQLANLRANLEVVHSKLDGLVIRAPVSGRVTALDLKVGENRSAGERLAEVTPDSGMKLSADIDEFYRARVRVGQTGTVDVGGRSTAVSVQRVSPQVRNGQFTIDLEFEGENPPSLVAGATAQGNLQLGSTTRARILATGPFIERTGADWAFVLDEDRTSAERRSIRVGRRTPSQLEILDGLNVGESVITSDYTGLERADRILLTQ